MRKKDPVMKICRTCKKEFAAPREDSKECSPECKEGWRKIYMHNYYKQRSTIERVTRDMNRIGKGLSGKLKYEERSCVL